MAPKRVSFSSSLNRITHSRACGAKSPKSVPRKFRREHPSSTSAALLHQTILPKRSTAKTAVESQSAAAANRLSKVAESVIHEP